MRQIVYNLHFRSKATPTDAEGKALRTTGSAVSGSTTTLLSPEGVESSYSAQPGDVALFESEVRITAPNVFTERGSISFGETHRLLFSCFGQGQLLPSTDDSNLMCGAVTWKVEGGEGQFEGATGLITSNFTLNDQGEINDYQLGLLFIK
jgi:hypothetical protein